MMTGDFEDDLAELLRLKADLTLAQVNMNACQTGLDRRRRDAAAEAYDDFYDKFVAKYKDGHTC